MWLGVCNLVYFYGRKNKMNLLLLLLWICVAGAIFSYSWNYGCISTFCFGAFKDYYEDAVGVTAKSAYIIELVLISFFWPLWLSLAISLVGVLLFCISVTISLSHIVAAVVYLINIKKKSVDKTCGECHKGE
jgi:hypothetical protein